MQCSGVIEANEPTIANHIGVDDRDQLTAAYTPAGKISLMSCGVHIQHCSTMTDSAASLHAGLALCSGLDEHWPRAMVSNARSDSGRRPAWAQAALPVHLIIERRHEPAAIADEELEHLHEARWHVVVAEVTADVVEPTINAPRMDRRIAAHTGESLLRPARSVRRYPAPRQCTSLRPHA
jgi:hypothetical protein